MKIEIDTTTIKRKIEENPIATIGALGLAANGIAKLMNANTARKNSKTWKKEVNRREKKSK